MQRLRVAASGSISLVAAALSLLVGCEGGQPNEAGPAGMGGIDSASDSGPQPTGDTPVASADAAVASADPTAGADVPTDASVAADPADVRPEVPTDTADASADTPVDSAPACTIGTAVDCAECGDPACTLANTLMACTSADQCSRAVCAVGFGNCDVSSLDCETSFASGSCLPSYSRTTAVATDYLYASTTAIATDGSFFLSGAFRGTVDFDPSAAEDIHSAAGPVDLAAFITKINADGSYAWTRSFSEPGVALGGVAAAAGGAVVAVGVFSYSIDLDPGPGVDQHDASPTSIGSQVLIVKLAADGSLVWGRTFEGTATERSGSTAGGVALDATDNVYLTGTFISTVDFDPGPGVALATAPLAGAGMVVKLTATGEFSWVRTVDEAPCIPSLQSLAVATDGTVWAVGSTSGSPGCSGIPIDLGPALPLIAAHTADGDLRGVWRLPVTESSFGTGVAAGANGSVYISGEGSGLIDLDPGPGVAMRWAGTPPTGLRRGGFLLKLAPDASLLWAQAFPEYFLGALAPTADGGVLAAGEGPTAVVAKLGPDGTPGWTFPIGGPGGTATAVAVRGSRFVVAGANEQTGDFDPGPGTEVVDGGIRFLSRFEF